MSNFSERLKELRKQKRLTQKGLSDSLGLAESTISMYESGKREPSFDLLDELADYFNVDIDYLLGKTDTTTKIEKNIYGDHQSNLRHLEDKPELLHIYNDIYESENLQLLFDKTQDLTPEDLEMVLTIISGIRKERGLD